MKCHKFHLFEWRLNDILKRKSSEWKICFKGGQKTIWEFKILRKIYGRSVGPTNKSGKPRFRFLNFGNF